MYLYNHQRLQDIYECTATSQESNFGKCHRISLANNTYLLVKNKLVEIDQAQFEAHFGSQTVPRNLLPD